MQMNFGLPNVRKSGEESWREKSFVHTYPKKTWVGGGSGVGGEGVVWVTNGAFTLHIKSVLNENLGGILGGTQY
jgi:hypothetical protein